MTKINVIKTANVGETMEQENTPRMLVGVQTCIITTEFHNVAPQKVESRSASTPRYTTPEQSSKGPLYHENTSSNMFKEALFAVIKN